MNHEDSNPEVSLGDREEGRQREAQTSDYAGTTSQNAGGKKEKDGNGLKTVTDRQNEAVSRKKYPENITGMRFGKLVAIREVERDADKRRCWECKCDCGKLMVTAAKRLHNHTCQSCGCRRAKMVSDLQKTHGESKSDEYRIWASMKDRCYNPKSVSYRFYGARGVQVCSEWLNKNGFDKFIACLGKRPTAKHSIDRINSRGNYEPGNVRWATRKEQNNNARSNVNLTFQGEILTMAQWADKIGLPYGCLQQRIIKLKWTLEKALTTKIQPGRFIPK